MITLANSVHEFRQEARKSYETEYAKWEESNRENIKKL